MAFWANRQAAAEIFANRLRGKRVWVNRQFAWQREVVAYVGPGAVSVVISTYFSTTDWDDPLTRKRLVIPAGVEVGANNTTYAFTTSSYAAGAAGSFAGELIVDNYGTISGMGGAANSGVGGNAVQAQHSGKTGQKYVLNNYGTIRAGGGGGGKGGNGGAGSYVNRDPASGDYYTSTRRYTVQGEKYANGQQFVTSTNYQFDGAKTLNATIGGWTYKHNPTYKPGSSPPDAGHEYQTWTLYYGVYRQQTISTTGGAGGNGARGQGFDGAAGTGANGAAGGTSAGAGGKGGNGGGWGASGAAGNTGASGNVGAGTAGAAGGLAGFYLSGSAYITLNNYGTVQGRYA